MERVLITGAGGFLGGHLINEAVPSIDLYGLTHTSAVNLKGDQWFRTSITDRNTLFKTLDRIRPTSIIHTAAISGESQCRKDIDHAREVNVRSCAYLAEWCTANDAYLLFTSTDLVFDGENAPYSEDAGTGSAMVYGQLKAEAEIALSAFSNILTVRLPLLYGIGQGARMGLLHQFISNCRDGKEQGLFSDEYRTPSYVVDVAAFLWKLVERKHTGIIHMGGRQRLSRLELGRKFCEHLDLPSDRLNSIKRGDIGMDYRPMDTSLDSSVAWNMGFDPGEIGERLSELRNDLTNRYLFD